jgi:hypothetical protein
MRKNLTLSEKIFRITQECSVIERNGVGHSNDENRPLYAYPKIDDVLAVVNPLLKKYRLVLTGNVPKEPMTHVSKGFATTECLVEWTLTNLHRKAASTYESQTWRIPGSGSDDQGKGVYKAITGSRKYAMVLIFNLKFGDEPEEINGRPATPEEHAQFREIVEGRT